MDFRVWLGVKRRSSLDVGLENMRRRQKGEGVRMRKPSVTVTHLNE